MKCVDETTKVVFITENSHWTTVCEVHSVLIFNPNYATRAKYVNWCTRSWESVRGYTLQGVIITANFWNDQVHYISMASKKLRGWRKFPLSHDQWDAIAWWGFQRVISNKFLQLFPRSHFAGKPVVALQNVRCSLSLIDKHYNDDDNNDYFDSKYDSDFNWAVWILNLSSPLPLFSNNDFSGISSNTTVIFADQYVNSHDLTAWLVIHCLKKEKVA